MLGTATNFEVKYRVLIFTGLYLLALACFRFHPKDLSYTGAELIACLVPVNTTVRFNYLLGAAAVMAAAYLRTKASAGLTDKGNRAATLSTHPTHLPMLLVFLGFGLLLNLAGFALLVAGMSILLSRLLTRQKRQSPSLQPRPEIGPPNWKRGLSRELYLWAFAAALITEAVTLNETDFYIALAIAVVTQFLCLAGPGRLREA